MTAAGESAAIPSCNAWRDEPDPPAPISHCVIAIVVQRTVSELNLLYVVDKLPERTREEVDTHLGEVFAELA